MNNIKHLLVWCCTGTKPQYKLFISSPTPVLNVKNDKNDTISMHNMIEVALNYNLVLSFMNSFSSLYFNVMLNEETQNQTNTKRHLKYCHVVHLKGSFNQWYVVYILQVYKNKTK